MQSPTIRQGRNIRTQGPVGHGSRSSLKVGRSTPVEAKPWLLRILDPARPPRTRRRSLSLGPTGKRTMQSQRVPMCTHGLLRPLRRRRRHRQLIPISLVDTRWVPMARFIALPPLIHVGAIQDCTCFAGTLADLKLVQTEPAVSPTTSSPLVASGVSPGLETVTAYDQRGFPTVVVQAKGAVKHYNDQGFLITDSPALAARASPTASYSPGGDGTSVTAIAQMNKKVTTTSSSAVSWQGPGPLFPLYLVVGALTALMGTVALQ